MPDEWSSSVATLTGRGDWIKWDFTIPDSTTADAFNGDPDFTSMFVAIRLALTAASRLARHAVIINDTITLALSGGLDNSSGSWVSANRFSFNEFSSSPGFETTDATLAWLPFGVPELAPFVVGTNSMRFLSLGRESDAASEPVQIDFVYLDTGPLADLANFSTFGTDAAAESAPAAFATHVNDNPFASPSDDHGWLLKAPDGTTGTAGMPTLRVVKFCPSSPGTITAVIKIVGGASPASGLVGVRDITTATIQTVTLDGAGMAEFTFPDTSDVVFWYAGTDDWMPLAVRLDDGFRYGCGNGWHVGRVGVGR